MSLPKLNGLFRLTRDAEIIHTQSGSTITKLGLASSEKYKDKETQLFIDAVAFGKTGEIISQYAGNKGTQIFLSGKIQTESWEKDGKKNYKTSFTIESFDFVSGQSQQPQQRQAPQVEYQNPQGQQVPPPQRQQAQYPPAIDIDMDSEVPF